MDIIILPENTKLVLQIFLIGFGKEIFGFNDKNGTRWKFCLIPLGGYVKFFGDRNVFK